ncbi:hypothetical protein KI387_037329, partial [Taxus chinensis]
TYMVNWSPNLQTAVSDLEVEYFDEPGTLFFFNYPVADGSMDEFLPVATTRPETLFGDTAIAVHPQDDRYRKYVGKMAIVPMSGGREIPIVADDYVDREFGTGALKITPGHDPNDYVIGKKLGLPLVNIMNKDGTLNENAGPYSGLDRFVARSRLWSDLETAGLALRAEPYSLRVPRSQRGGEVIEYLVSKQWFVIMEPLAKKALEAVESRDLKIIPERFEKPRTTTANGQQKEPFGQSKTTPLGQPKKPLQPVPSMQKELLKISNAWDTRNDLMRKGLCFNCKDPWTLDQCCLGKGHVHYIEAFSDCEEGAKSEEELPKHESDEDMDVSCPFLETSGIEDLKPFFLPVGLRKEARGRLG